PPRYLYNKDLFFLKNENSEEKSYIMSLHKIHDVPFPEDDLEEKMIVEVVRVTTKQQHELDFLEQIIVMREHDKPNSFSKDDFKYLNKSAIEDLYYLCRNKKVNYLNIEHMVKVSEKARILEHKRRVQESLLILITYTMYHSRSIRPKSRRKTPRNRRPDITIEEYIRLKTEKALRKGKVYNWETATYGKTRYDEDVHFLRSIEMEFPAIVYNDALTSELELSCEPTKKLGKNNEAKRTRYHALPCKEYERVFMCKIAKEVWHTLIITDQGNSQVKNCNIDLLTEEYEKFSISHEETIDSSFTRFNTIVTSLKSLDPDYSSKNHVRKFLHALPLKWRAKVTAIEEAKDLATLPLDKVIKNLKVHKMILDNDGVGSKTTKEKVKSLALKAKVTREQTRTSASSFARVIGLDTEIDLVMAVIECHFASECRKLKENKAFIGGAWSDSEDGNEQLNDVTCLMAIDSQEENEELLEFNKDFAKRFEKVLNEKRSLEKENSKLLSKINDLKLEVNKLENDKEVVKPCKTCDVLTKEVDSLKCNVFKLRDEALNFSKFKESSIDLDNILSRQKLSEDKEGLGYDRTTSASPNKPIATNATDIFTLVSGSADRKGLIENVITKTMMEPTMEEYVNKTRGDYYSGITKTMINGKAAYELKRKFLNDLRNNAFSGTNREDAVEHIENFIMIVDPLNLPNVSYERLRLAVFSISLTGDASEWLMNEPQSSFTTWVDLIELVFRKYYPLLVLIKLRKGDDQEVLTDEAFSDLEENKEYEIAEIFRIEIDIFNFETPLCTTFNEFNYMLKIDTDLFTHDIQGDKTYKEYENEWSYKLDNDAKEPRNDDERKTNNDHGIGNLDNDLVRVFSTWMAFGGNTRDLGSFGEETDKITDLHQIHEEVLFTERGDGVADIKRRRCDLSSDDVRDLATASRRGRV
ncbi:hypothetical protein Tco_0643672, partial [Tanacetum coccineum]